MWESVLRRSLQSGDQDRLEAAISLAESGGAGEEVLAAAREKLRSIATASLARAREGSDPSTLSAAIDRADELRADADELQESRKELRRLAHSRLQSAVRSGDIAELEAALRLAAVAGAPDAALVASAQRKLRELIEPAAPAGAGESHCVLEIAAGADCSEDEDRRAAERGIFSWGAPRPGKLGGERDVPQASLVPPMVIGRQESGDVVMLEAGLRKQHHKVVPSAPPRAGLRKQAAARDANAQECTVQ